MRDPNSREVMIGAVLAVVLITVCCLVSVGCGRGKYIQLQTWEGNSRAEREVCVEWTSQTQRTFYEERFPPTSFRTENGEDVWIMTQCKRREKLDESVMVGYSGSSLYKCKVDPEFYAAYAEEGSYLIPREQCREVKPDTDRR